MNTSASPLSTDADVPDELKDGRGVWYALPPVYVAANEIYLRTLVDAQTDNRLLLLYDQCGRIRRSRAIQAPIGIAAAAGNLVYAVSPCRRA